jgi:hypothetical protein
MRTHRLVTAAVLAGSILGISVSTFALQRNGSPVRGSGGQSRPTGPAPQGSGGQSRPTRTPPQGGDRQVRQAPAPPVHAQREAVRTPNFVPRTNVGAAPRQAPPAHSAEPGDRTNVPPNRLTVRRPLVQNAPAVQVQRKFTKTPTGRVYDNGLTLRKGVKVSADWQRHFFPKGHYHFPFYRNAFVRGQTFRSPFGVFFGVCVPYISASECHVYPSAVVFIDIPVYNGVQCTGFSDAGDQNLFNDPNLNQDQPGLENAIDELTEAFQGGNIDGLVTLVDPNSMIAVYVGGHYQYSLSASDYIDLSRDAIQSMHTVQFNLSYLHQRASGVFSVAGRQTYQDPQGQVQTTWVSFVLQDISGQWTLTQVGTAPGRKQTK